MNTIKRLKEKKAELVTHKAKYAGEEFFYEKELDDKERKRLSQVEKNRTHKALDTLVDCITKKKDVNVFDKSKIDWKNYVKKHELERELDFNRKDGYLNKKRFIEETNLKIQDIRKAHEKKSRYSTKNKYHI